MTILLKTLNLGLAFVALLDFKTVVECTSCEDCLSDKVEGKTLVVVAQQMQHYVLLQNTLQLWNAL
jgi:hypothetical protein